MRIVRQVKKKIISFDLVGTSKKNKNGKIIKAKPREIKTTFIKINGVEIF